MRSTRSYTAVEVHAEGEQGTCYLGSVFEVPGASMRDKLRYVNEVDDSIRRFLCFEPRGRPQTSSNLVFPSLDPQAHAGFIICQADRAHA
ncbi:MAG: proline racemase family protein, partial [Ilumatobacteraceae bacterium]